MAASDAFYQDIINELVPIFDELGASYTIRGTGVYDEDELESLPGATRSAVGLIADQQTVLELAGELGATWVSTKTLILRQDAAPMPGEDVLVSGKWFPLSRVVSIRPADVTVVYLLDVSR